MKCIKKIILWIVTVSVALTISYVKPDVFVGSISVCAEETTAKDWWVDANTYGKSKITIDKKNVYKDSAYSIKIENTDYNCVVVKNTFNLKPETTYRFSAYVKYKGYSLKAKSDGDSGARIGAEVKGGMANLSDMGTDSNWKKLTYTFTTDKDRTSADFILCNGLPNRFCKGTAWFSDIRLEEVTAETNRWNILAVVIKDVNAKAKVNGKTIRYKASLNDKDIKYVGNVINLLKTNMPEMSGGRVGVSNIDVYSLETTLTTLGTPRNCVDLSLDSGIAAEIDKYLAQKEYQQIIITVPLGKVADGWIGLGGSKYKGINICQVAYDSGSEWLGLGKVNAYGYSFPTGVYIHEILHGVDNESKAIDGDKTPNLHENIGIYSDYYNENDGWYKYYSDYMSRKLPDKRGINPDAFWRNSVHTLITDNMTPGDGIEVSGTIPTHISKVVTTSEISDKYYSGKSVKPALKVKNAIKDKDYTISYRNNNAPGLATAVIKGKGKYTGSVEITFNINLKRTTSKISKSTLKWAKIKGADGYEIYYSKDGKKFKKFKDMTVNEYNCAKLKKGSYKFKIRAYASTNVGMIYSDWSDEVSFTKK